MLNEAAVSPKIFLYDSLISSFDLEATGLVGVGVGTLALIGLCYTICFGAFTASKRISFNSS